MDLLFSLTISNNWKGKNQWIQDQSNCVKTLTVNFILFMTHTTPKYSDCCIKEQVENFFNKKSISNNFITDTSKAL